MVGYQLVPTFVGERITANCSKLDRPYMRRLAKIKPWKECKEHAMVFHVFEPRKGVGQLPLQQF